MSLRSFENFASVADEEDYEGNLNARLLEGVLEVDESNSDDSECKIVRTVRSARAKLIHTASHTTAGHAASCAKKKTETGQDQ